MRNILSNSKRKSTESQFIFLAVFAFNLIIAYFLVFKSGYIADEAIIRTSQALDLIEGSNKGRQSLICSLWWPPLPTLIQLPLVFCKFHLYKLFLNNIVSSVFAAGSMVFLNILFKRCDLNRAYRYIVLAAFQLNPLILFYSANGTSQMMFVLFLIASLYYLSGWLKENSLRGFLLMTLNTSLLCLIRLEGVFYAAAILAIVIIVTFYRKYQVSRKEGLLLLYLAPVGYLISLWFLFNWLIMGDWLYFLRGIFLNPIHLESSPPTLFELAKIAFLIAPFYLLMVVLSLLYISIKRKGSLPSLLVVSLVPPLFCLIMAGRGQLAAPLGSLVILLPFGYVLLAEFLDHSHAVNPVRWRLSHSVKKYILLVLLIASLFPVPALRLIKGEMNRVDKQRREMAEMGAYLAKYKTNSEILVTDFRGYLFRYYSGGTYSLTHCFDFGLGKIPLGEAPVYLLVPCPGDKIGSESIHWKYPHIYKQGTGFTILDKNFASWRVFRIIRVDNL